MNGKHIYLQNCIRTAPVDVYLAEEIAKDEFFKYSYSTCWCLSKNNRKRKDDIISIRTAPVDVYHRYYTKRFIGEQSIRTAPVDVYQEIILINPETLLSIRTAPVDVYPKNNEVERSKKTSIRTAPVDVYP